MILGRLVKQEWSLWWKSWFKIIWYFIFVITKSNIYHLNERYLTMLYNCRHKKETSIDWLIDWLLVFNATFSNISPISWRPALVVEEAGAPGENDWRWASKRSTLSLAAASRVHPFCNLQSRVRTYAALVIGWYVLLGNPTT
jgi:hypothetical protein